VLHNKHELVFQYEHWCSNKMVILSVHTRTLLVRLLQHRSFKSSLVKFQTIIMLNSTTSVRGSANLCYLAVF